jgi:hypothetical protein
MIDLTRWNLTTPELKPGTTDEATTYAPGHFPAQSEYFGTTGDSLWVYAPTKGLGTTANSDRSRSELRECNPDGTQLNFKVQDVPDNILSATLNVVQYPKKGKTTIGQIHVKNNTRPMLKLIHNGLTGEVVVSYRKVFNQPDPVNETIVSNASAGTPFSYNVHMQRAGVLSIDVLVDGVLTERSYDVDPSWFTQLLYFKAGTYIQEDADASTLATEGSRIQFSALGVFHGEYAEPVPEPEVPEVPEPTAYELLGTRLADLEDQYYSRLKALQTEVKTELNSMTTEMKLLTDKALLAPVYTEISAFKARMVQGMTRPVL